jgi:hypothetical protein
MYADGKPDIASLKKKWGFSAGEDSGIAAVNVPNVERSQPLDRAQGEINASFPYAKIQRMGNRSWQFLDKSGVGVLLISLISNDALSLQYNTAQGLPKTIYFASLPVPLDDLAVQEATRRDSLYQEILLHGSTYNSAWYGRLNFTGDSHFSWSGFDRLVPAVIPSKTLPTGRVEMRLFLSNELSALYDGALSLFFSVIGGGEEEIVFLYPMEGETGGGERGLRLEQVYKQNIENWTVVRRAPSPIVIFFYSDN